MTHRPVLAPSRPEDCNDSTVVQAMHDADAQAVQYQSDADACMSTLLPPPAEIVAEAEAQPVPWWSWVALFLWFVFVAAVLAFMGWWSSVTFTAIDAIRGGF